MCRGGGKMHKFRWSRKTWPYTGVVRQIQLKINRFNPLSSLESGVPFDSVEGGFDPCSF